MKKRKIEKNQDLADETDSCRRRWLVPSAPDPLTHPVRQLEAPGDLLRLLFYMET